MSLKRKVAISILIIGFLVLTIGLPITYYQVKNLVAEDAGRDFEKLAIDTAEDLSSKIKKEITLFRYLSQNRDIINGVKAGGDNISSYLAYFFSFEKERKSHVDILIVNAQGTVLAAGKGIGYSVDQSRETWWRNVSRSKRVYISDIYEDKVSGQRIIDIGIPVIDPVSESVVGGIRDILDVEVFFESLRAVRFGHTGHIMLINSQGFPLIFPKRIQETHSLSTDLLKVIKINKKGWILTSHGPHNKREAVIGFAPVRIKILSLIRSPEWYLIVWQDPSETFAPVNRLVLKLFFFESLLVFLLSIGGYVAVQYILIAPITQLLDGMKRIERGDLEYTVPITAKDEIGALAERFNKMRMSLKSLYDELEEKIKKRTKELEHTKNYLESILKYSSDMIITTDLEGRIVTFNEGAERMLGYKREEVIGKYMADYYYRREDRQKILELIKEKKMVTNYETQLVRKDGKVIDISLSISLLRDEHGKVIGTVGISKDITEWKKAQKQLEEYSQHLEAMVEKRTQELKESKSHLEAMLSGIADGVVFVNQDNRITFINEAAETIFGLKREEWIGRDFKYAHSERAHEKALQLIKDMKEGKIKSYVTEIQKDEKTIYAHFSPIMHENEYLGVIFIARDITEMKRLQNELLQAEKFALVGKMSSAIAHELRNPLVPIGGFANLIYRKAEEGSPIKRYADIIVKEIERLESLLKSVLYFTKDIKPAKKLCNINEIIHDALFLYNRTFSDKKIELNVKLADDLPSFQVDPSKIKQVLINIFTNAIHAMEKEGGVLTVETSTITKDGTPYCTIKITDTGVGIPEEIKKHIFDPFFTTRVSGLGLGLTLTKRIVEAHGGFIEVESQEGVGTTFTIYLPMEDKGP